MVTNAIKGAQSQVESANFEMRKNVLKYDEVMNEQRKVIYGERRQILEGEDVEKQIRNMLKDTIEAYVDGATAEGYVEDWDLDTLWNALDSLYGPTFTHEELVEGDDYGRPGELSSSQLLEALLDDANREYDELEEKRRRHKQRAAPYRCPRTGPRSAAAAQPDAACWHPSVHG
nr:hypothetical protein [Campylobacter jejuni]